MKTIQQLYDAYDAAHFRAKYVLKDKRTKRRYFKLARSLRRRFYAAARRLPPGTVIPNPEYAAATHGIWFVGQPIPKIEVPILYRRPV